MSLRTAIAAISCAVLAPLCLAEEEGPNPLDPVLVSEVTSILPGEPFWVGLWLDHPENYHSYWVAPGIVGIPTELKWDLPEGFAADPILYPVPERVSMSGINAHGYHGQTLLMVKITPPDTIAGDSVRLPALASWMCCWKTCHPGFKRIDISLLVSRDPKADHFDPKWRPVFESTRAKLPTQLLGWDVAATESEKNVTFKITPRQAADPKPNPDAASVYFFCGDGQINSGSPQVVSRGPDGTLTLTMARSQFGPADATTYPGLLFCEEGWLAGGTSHYGSVAVPRTHPLPVPSTAP